MSQLTEIVTSLVYGLASALVPVVNAEAFAVLRGARTAPRAAALVVLALAAGQTAGKLVLFEAARRGAGRLAARFAHRPERTGRGAARVDRALARRRTGLPLVLSAACLGVPPLAVVSLAAGASRQPRWQFVASCLVGRTVRFAVLVVPAALAMA